MPFYSRLSFILIGLSLGCHSQHNVSYVVVAAVDSRDEASQSFVAKVLKDEGIDCVFDGSVVNGLLVKEGQEQRAIKCLRDAKQLVFVPSSINSLSMIRLVSSR